MTIFFVSSDPFPFLLGIVDEGSQISEAEVEDETESGILSDTKAGVEGIDGLPSKS